MFEWIKNQNCFKKLNIANSKIEQYKHTDNRNDNSDIDIKKILEERYAVVKKTNSNIFLKLNEHDYLKKIISSCLCNYHNCHMKAINSHTYPYAFLKNFSNNKPLYSICIDKVATQIYSDECNQFINESTSKQAGVAHLFCDVHDTNIFKKIENSNENVDIETYLYLFLYRAFIYDYVIEGMVKKPPFERKINQAKSYSKKIDKETEINYLTEHSIVENIANMFYSYKFYETVKIKFDKIFKSTNSPNKKNFNKYFKIYYYELISLPKFVGIGSMYFSYDQTQHLPSTYGIVPDKKGEKYYFSVLVPNEEVETMSEIIKHTEMEHKKYKEGKENDFLTIVLFQILDSSQNMIFNGELMESMDTTEIEFLEKMYYYLVFSRSIFNNCNSSSIRNYVYMEIKNNKTLLNKIFCV